MAFLFNIPATGGFSCESHLRRGAPHCELVPDNPDGTAQLVTDKIHVWRAFLFFGGGYPVSISCSGIQEEMALCGALLLYGVLYLDLGIYRISFCLDCLQSRSKKIRPIHRHHCSFISRSVGDALLCLSRYL